MNKSPYKNQMKLLSRLRDIRINADNYLIEMTAREYLELAADIIANNEFQRRQVKASNTIYSLLKSDLRTGCVIPPIVLALRIESDSVNEETIIESLAANKQKLVILDGLQRTLTLLDLKKDLAGELETGDSTFESLALRIEMYVGVNRLGILYRMLTLNTGQTPMSLRQQVEMLYLDFANIDVNGVRLIREVDEDNPKNLGEYNFKVMVEGFNSYIERDELPIDRMDILDNIKGLDHLSRENREEDVFRKFLNAFHAYILRLEDIAKDFEFDSEMLGISGQPYGRSARRIFTKSAAVSGFGAAIGKLKHFNKVSGFEDIIKAAPLIVAEMGVDAALAKLLLKLEEIRLRSKKIGNAQRMFFQFYFRELFNPEGDSYLDLFSAAENGFQKYLSQTE